jgi:hypothetical protein
MHRAQARTDSAAAITAETVARARFTAPEVVPDRDLV